MFRAATRALRQAAQPAGARGALVVHVAGKNADRVITDVSDVFTRVGGDILGSRGTVLGNDFSMMMVVKCAQEHVEELEASLNDLNDLSVWTYPSANPDVVYTVPHRHAVKVVRLTGHDAPGIVMHYADYLNQHGCRVLNIASEMAAAPFTDDPMFKLRVVVDKPIEVPDEVLEEGVDVVSDLIGVDVWVESMC